MFQQLSVAVSRAVQAATNPVLGFLGALALGIFFGFLAFGFVARSADYAIAGIASVAAAVGAAAIMGLLDKLNGETGKSGNSVATYFIGLVLGAVLWGGAAILDFSDDILPPSKCDCVTPSPSISPDVSPSSSPGASGVALRQSNT